MYVQTNKRERECARERWSRGEAGLRRNRLSVRSDGYLRLSVCQECVFVCVFLYYLSMCVSVRGVGEINSVELVVGRVFVVPVIVQFGRYVCGRETQV